MDNKIRPNEQRLWTKVNIAIDRFKLKHVPKGLEKAKLAPGFAATVCALFLLFITPVFLTSVWDSYPRETWYYTSGGKKCLLNHGVCPISTLYVYLAIYIRLCGRGFPFRPTRSPLRTAIEEALAHFHSIAPDGTKIPGRDLLEVIFARFHFTHQHMAALCANFRSSLSCIGQVFACDEKLFHFTGKSGYIRIVPQKRDIGIWIYDGVCTLASGDHFLIYCRQSLSNKATNISEPVIGVMKQWADIAVEFKHKSNYVGPVLAFDSYYGTIDSTTECINRAVMFIASVRSDRFEEFTAILRRLCPPVAKPGDTQAIWCEEKQLLYVHHWDIDVRIGKKFALSNAFEKTAVTRSSSNVIPVYDHYDAMYRGCDQFHKGFYNELFPYKPGGGHSLGESGCIHKFLMGVTIQNTFNGWKNVGPQSELKQTFHDQCVCLSDLVFAHALTLM